MNTLSDEQNRIVGLVLQGENVLITGPGGTGKSFLLEHLIDLQRSRCARFMACAATGVAAVRINSTTVHSAFGIGLGQGSIHTLVNNIKNNVPAAKRLKSLDALMIDEISMISAELFTKLDGVLKILRSDARPFGGVQLILFGDMLQLPPVEGEYVFKSPAWKAADIRVVTLTKIFRQEDAAFASALNQLRLGSLDETSRAFFNARARARDPNPEIPPVEITAKNATADSINARRLAELPGEEAVFDALDTGSPSGLKLLEKCTIPKVLTVKKGARVMCCHNFAADGVMNGSCGTVLASLKAPFDRVKVIFDNGVEKIMEPITREITRDGEVLASRTQIPLRLSWASSAHRVQGCTLDKIRVHMAEAFEHSQQYVALSRVRTPEGLFIASMNKNMITANPAALEFYGQA